MTKIKTYLLLALVVLTASVADLSAKDPEIAPSYAWEAEGPLGIRREATIDTLLYNYFQVAIPSAASPAYATTGNLGAEGLNMIFFDRKQGSPFFFRNAVSHWLPARESHKFYNTRIPMTLLSYNTGGTKETTQDHLKAIFSGNVNKRLQIGAHIDFIYSKGSYDRQATNDIVWGASASYMGDRYELQAFYNNYNMLNKENGGITDDLYITDPAEIQGGVSTIDSKSIPVNLSDAHSRMRGSDLYINNRYKLGYWHEEKEGDSIVSREYIPVTSFIYTLQFTEGKHKFINTNASQDRDFWPNSYIGLGGTNEVSRYYSVTNTVGISLLEGFNKWAKAGLAVYLSHELRKYRQIPDTVPMTVAEGRPEDLTPYPLDHQLPSKASENFLWVGGRLTKQRGSILTYDAGVEIGVAGRAAGEVKADGNVSTRFRLKRDSVKITGYAHFRNEAPWYLLNRYVSNHFIWDNDFGKIRSIRAGGILDIPHTGSRLNIGVENLQNYIYFNADGLPVQHSKNVQVFQASLEQNLHVGILHWNNRVVYQTSSDQSVIPLPKLSVYSNLFLLFKVAKVLHVQFGVDCDYYTSYKAPSYQPATMAFVNQNEIECGNYPFMNVYANMKLSKARFFVLLSHFNQGLFGKDNYFSMPHYPLNPRRFLVGVSVDFNN